MEALGSCMAASRVWEGAFGFGFLCRCLRSRVGLYFETMVGEIAVGVAAASGTVIFFFCGFWPRCRGWEEPQWRGTLAVLGLAALIAGLSQGD